MPELAEVAYYARQWDTGLGQAVLRVHANPAARVFKDAAPQAYAPALAGQKYRSAETHGKNMLFRFGARIWLGGHLGMTGELLCEGPDYQPGKHDHLAIFQKKQTLIFRDPRKFGALRLSESKTAPDWWANLPPSVLDPRHTPEVVAAFLARRPKSPIKPLLLDQDAFPGIGNWMADEILWRIRLHPATPASSISPAKAKQLAAATREVSQDAMDTIAPDWSDPPDTWLFNHRWKDGGNCPRCQTPLTRQDLRGRTACWCERCQAAS